MLKKQSFQKILDFFSFYSLLGFLFLTLIAWSFLEIVLEVENIYNSHDLIINQEAPSGIQIEFSHDGFFVFFVIFFLFYYFIFTLRALFIRRRFKKYLEKEKVGIFCKGTKLAIKLYQNPRRWPFFLFCNIDLIPRSFGNYSLDYKKRPKGFIRENDFVFDLSHLKTGKYKINTMIFSFEDPLRLISAKLKYKNKNNFSFVIFSKKERSKKIFKKNAKNALLDSKIQKFSSVPLEGYFGAKEYSRGDDTKKIHWKNTAKRGKLFIRTPEEESVEETDLNFLINLYCPHVNQVDLSNSISDFLEICISSLIFLTKEKSKNINLFINGEKIFFHKDLGLSKKERIQELILKNSEIQDFRNLSSFLRVTNLEKFILFSFSTDESLQNEIEKAISFFIFDSFSEFEKTYFEKFKKILFFKREEYFPSLESIFKTQSLRFFLNRKKAKKLEEIKEKNKTISK